MRWAEGASALPLRWANRQSDPVTDFPAATPAPLSGFMPRDQALPMGVLNAAPDSLSDDDHWAGPEATITHTHKLVAQGTDIIDVGGESTRPGAQRVDVDTEISRVLSMVRALPADTGEGGGSAIVSVDTIHAVTTEAAIDADTHIISDVSGGLTDPTMHDLIAHTGVAYICQHWRSDLETMDRLTDYPGGVVAGVEAGLCGRLAELDAAEVDYPQVVPDPGLGFAKTHAQSWELLAAVPRPIADLGRPPLVSSPCKRFLAQAAEAETTPVQRGTVVAATTALAAAGGIWTVRIHEVPANRAVVHTAFLWKGHQ